MTTPICDFIEKYASDGFLRLHMPAHKGIGMGYEREDITEICGADSLFDASGIIAESERNASELFGCDTIYSVEGSSLCIRTMIAMLKVNDPDTVIYAGRNAHRAFVTAVALTDIDVEWLDGKESASYLSCDIDLESLDERLSHETRPIAVYITSPDYLGGIADIRSISTICRKHGAILLVDNAHGAYLRFLSPSKHPIDLGADICCDSAHKTLPTLTGCAYLHIGKSAPEFFKDSAKSLMSVFASTSPSYILMSSLDRANAILSDGYPERLREFCELISRLKSKLSDAGYTLIGDEATKLTVATKDYGYLGNEFSDILRKNKIEVEFFDPDFSVMMLAPEIGKDGLERLERVMLSIERRDAITDTAPIAGKCLTEMSIREAMFSKFETVSVKDSLGRILAQPSVSCPPAVLIAACGEVIDETAIKCFEYYGINEISVKAKTTNRK